MFNIIYNLRLFICGFIININIISQLIYSMQKIRKYFEAAINNGKIGFNLTTDIMMDLYKHAMRKHFSKYFDRRIYASFFIFVTSVTGVYFASQFYYLQYYDSKLRSQFQTEYGSHTRELIEKKKGYAFYEQQNTKNLIQKGLERGLISFELLQLAEYQKQEELKWHGNYLAKLKS